MKGYFYRTEKTGRAEEPVEDDHAVEWHGSREAAERLKLAHQKWAVEKGLAADSP